MAVDWRLGTPQPGFGEGFQQGLAREEGRQQQNALLADQRDYRQAQQENLQSQTRERDLEAHRDTFIIGAELLRNVPNDPDPRAAYQRALAAGREYGLPMQDVPPEYDPDYVRNVVETGTRLAAIGQRQQGQQQQFTLGEGQVRYDANGNVVARGAAPRPRYYPVPQGGRLELDPAYQNGAAPEAQGDFPEGTVIENEAGEQMVRQGGQWVPAQGGAGQPGPRTFP